MTEAPKINALAERAAARADRRPDRQAAPMGRQVPLEDFRIKALPMSDGITMYELPKQEAIDVTEKPQ